MINERRSTPNKTNFADTFVVAESSVFQMNFSGKKVQPFGKCHFIKRTRKYKFAMCRIILSMFLLFFTHITYAQISGMWHSSSFDVPFTDFSMKLKGNVKSWTMTQSNGKSRTMTFDKSGNILSDSYSGTPQTFIYPEFALIKLKNKLEKSRSANEIKDTTCTFNNKMQLVERRYSNNFEKNVFDNDGKILIHQRAYTTIETRAWNSLGHDEPTYTYPIKTSTLAFFKYNNKGSLREISYFSSNSENNLKIVYTYDQENNMIETKRYDNLNISVKKDNYLDTIMTTSIDTNFSIEVFYPKYWKVGEPAKNIWKYNEKGQKIEWHVYGYKPNGRSAILSTIIKWEYDKNGKLLKEIEYNYWVNKVSMILNLEQPSKVIEFDHYGNVVKETRLRNDGTISLVSEMKIHYFDE